MLPDRDEEKNSYVLLDLNSFIYNVGLMCSQRAKHSEIILSVGLWQHGENLSALN